MAFSLPPAISSFMTKVGIGVGLISIIPLACLAIFLFYKYEVNQAQSAITAAKNSGYTQAQTDQATAANAALMNAIKNLEKDQQATNDKLNQIQNQTVIEKKAIDSYDAADIAVQHPQEVEDWANKTNNSLFADIQSDTQVSATKPN